MRLLEIGKKSMKRMLLAPLYITKQVDDAFFDAAQDGHNNTMERLLKIGARIEARDQFGGTALIRATFKGRTKTCAFLLDRLANEGGNVKKYIEAKDKNGWAALHHAAYSGSFDTCILLVERYANMGGDIKKFITAKNSDGKTAMDLAVSKRHTEIAKFFGIHFFRATFGIKATVAFLKPFNECLAS
jgi:ankyrin repeat protein